MPGPSAPDHPPTAPTGLTVDDDPAPLAVTGPPAFGWIVNDPDRGETQKGYEIVVTDAPASGPHTVLVDSRTVTGNQQSYVHLPGLNLRARPPLLVDGAHAGRRRSVRAVLGRGPLRHRPSPTPTGARRGSGGAAPSPTQPDDFSLLRKQATLTASPVGARPRLRGRGPAVRAPRERHPRRRRTVVLVSRRAVLRDDRRHRARPGRSCQRVRVRDALVDARSGPAAVARGVHRAHQCRPRRRHVARCSPPTRRGVRTRVRGSRRRPATTRATSSNMSTSASIRPAGTVPGSTTAAGSRRRCSEGIRGRRSRTSSRRARTSSFGR